MADDRPDPRRGLRLERRAHGRDATDLGVHVEVEIYGFENRARPFFSSGTATGVGRGGMLARLDAPLRRGAVCKVFFRDVGVRVRPRHIDGRVVRCDETDDGFMVAIAFANQLLHFVDEAGPLAATA